MRPIPDNREWEEERQEEPAGPSCFFTWGQAIRAEVRVD